MDTLNLLSYLSHLKSLWNITKEVIKKKKERKRKKEGRWVLCLYEVFFIQLLGSTVRMSFQAQSSMCWHQDNCINTTQFNCKAPEWALCQGSPTILRRLSQVPSRLWNL